MSSVLNPFTKPGSKIETGFDLKPTKGFQLYYGFRSLVPILGPNFDNDYFINFKS